MKVRDRIGTLTDLFLGALYADRQFSAEEEHALRVLLQELVVSPELPAEAQRRIREFRPERFDMAEAALEFGRDPPMSPRRLLELVAQLCAADDEFDLDKDDYVRRLGRALGLAPTEYEDLVIDYETLELEIDVGEDAVTASASSAPAPRPLKGDR